MFVLNRDYHHGHDDHENQDLIEEHQNEMKHVKLKSRLQTFHVRESTCQKIQTSTSHFLLLVTSIFLTARHTLDRNI